MSIMQLAANRSRHDATLYDAPPDASFFRQRVARATNFSIEPIARRLHVSALGGTAAYDVERVGDMLGPLILRTKFRPLRSTARRLDENVYHNFATPEDVDYEGVVTFANGMAHAMVREAALAMNGSVVDRQDKHSMHFQYELFGAEDKDLGELSGYRMTNVLQYEDGARQEGATYHTFLPFWFCRDPSAYLPLIAMQFTDVQVFVTTEHLSDLVVRHRYDDPTQEGPKTLAEPLDLDRLFEKMEVVAHYVFLDVEEREALASQPPTDYPVLTCQGISHDTAYDASAAPTTSVSVELDTLSHPTQFMCFAVQEAGKDEPLDYSGKVETIHDFVYEGRLLSGLPRPLDPVKSAQLVFNGARRYREPITDTYMRQVTPYLHFPRIPREYVYTINFALRPGTLQPSGSANFSRLDKKRLDLELRTNPDHQGRVTVIVRTFAFNTLRVAGGMASLLYI